MAYIPPHKRHSKDPQRPTSVPEMLVPELNRKLNLGSRKHNAGMKVNYVEYADHAVHKWFVCGLDNDNSFPSSVHFEEFPEELVEHERGAGPLVLVTNNPAKDNDEVSGNILRSPWEFIAENIWPDVLSACKIVKKEMDEKPTLTARFGNLLFNKYDLLSLESAREGQVAETALSPVWRFFYRGVSATYIEKIVNEVVPKIGLIL